MDMFKNILLKTLGELRRQLLHHRLLGLTRLLMGQIGVTCRTAGPDILRVQILSLLVLTGSGVKENLCGLKCCYSGLLNKKLMNIIYD